MVKKYCYKGIDWIDLESPTQGDVKDIVKTYSLDSLVAAELFSKNPRVKIDNYDDYLYLALHFPIFNTRSNEFETREINFIIGKNFIISTHYGPFSAVEELGQIFEATEWFSGRDKEVHGGHIFFFIARGLYEALYPLIDKVNKDLKIVRDSIFETKEKLTIEQLSDISQTLINFKKPLRSNKEIFSPLLVEAGSLLFGEEYGFYAQSLLGECEKVISELETSQETLNELHQTNNSLISIKTNKIIKKLTLIVSVILPIILIAAIFSMNTKLEFTPILGLNRGFWVIIILMAIIALSIYSFLKNKKWL